MPADRRAAELAPRARTLPDSLVTPLAVLGALLVLSGDAYHLFVLDDRPSQSATAAYRLHGLAIMLGLGLLTLATLAVARRSRLAAIGVPLLVVGTALVIGDVWAEVVVLPGVVRGENAAVLGEDIGGAHLALVIAAYATFAIGWVLYALSMRRVVGAAAWALALGGVLAFLPIGGSYVLLAIAGALVASQASGLPDAD